MTIILLSKQDYNDLKKIQKEYPKLTFQNNGYEYIKNLSEEELKKVEEVNVILKRAILRFSEFNNFRLTSDGRIQLRFQYGYDNSFTGVGYILLEELYKGFEKK